MRFPSKIRSGCAACVLACVLVAASGDASAQTANLSANIGELHVRGAALADVVHQIGNATGQDIFVNWRALKSIHVTRDLPVTVDLSNLPLSQAINRLLERVSGPHVRLGYLVDEGTVTISAADDLSKNVSTRVYDVRAAIKPGPTREKDVKAVIRRIEGVDPLSWKQYGGATGDVREVEGQLVVTATPEVQSLVAAELRDVLPPSPAGAAR